MLSESMERDQWHEMDKGNVNMYVRASTRSQSRFLAVVELSRVFIPCIY